ncbi:hypothetical protein M5C72_02835 [Companilactobacillus allii]|uniref:Holin n=1 Tax=Companilactobacillus allii TaxID=1847728 RepID=A0A1P8Q2S4_9LACO|nr:hypothetical protein [Companilactobacillus allii]APX72099.1 hypothetical protein BTM29_05760 [Companilactobacillus allii]USQ69191.1 hypothetical protein M5C72_02835 [Companilactobacillus allii]
MDIIQNLNLINATELILIALICYGLTQAAKQSKLKSTYMPFISMVVGAFVGIIVALIMHDSELGKAGIVGFLVGGWTSGLFTGVKAVINDKKEILK